MKLLKLKLNDSFRGLKKGFEVDFLKDFDKTNIWDFMPYCIVGRNGSGKSNILEALAAIFYHIECIYLEYKPEGFEGDGEFNDIHTDGFFAEYCLPNAFELEYLVPIPLILTSKRVVETNKKTLKDLNAHILIEKKENERPILKWINREEFTELSEANEELNRVEVKYFLPDFIIGYSSGENEILSLPFFKMRFIHFDEYRDRLSKQLDYGKPEGRMIFLDAQYSQAVILCNYLFLEKEKLKPFKTEIGIDDVAEFRIIIKCDYLLDVHEDYYHALPMNRKTNDADIKVALISNVSKAIEKLKKCSTANYYDNETKFLYLDYYITNETKKAFQFHFLDAINLFQTFQVLLTLNFYKLSDDIKSKIYRTRNLYINHDVVPEPFDEERIFRFKELRLKKEGVNDVIYTKSLSDGEHQLLHSMGICLLFKDKNVLFLFDEPETHFNPDWKSKFISTLRTCLASEMDGKNILRDLLITSHSPFIVSDCPKEKVIIIENGKATSPSFNTFGTSINILTEEVLGTKESISGLPLERINEIKANPWNTLRDIQEAKEASRMLGESVEKVLLFRELLIRENELKTKDA